MADNLLMEISLESIAKIQQTMNLVANVIENDDAKHFEGEILERVTLDDGMWLIGFIVYSPDFDREIAFIPNGTWFGDFVPNFG